MSKQSHRQRLIDTFVNRIYLYDDKLVITFNHKDGTETITLNDIEAALAETENSSDLVSFAVPKRRMSFGTSFFLDIWEGSRTIKSDLPGAGRASPSSRRCFLTICRWQIGSESLPVYSGSCPRQKVVAFSKALCYNNLA